MHRMGPGKGRGGEEGGGDGVHPGSFHLLRNDLLEEGCAVPR